MKKICIVCGKTRGKRSCLLNPNELVCPVCCATIRHEACQGCMYYTVAQQYHNAKNQKNITNNEIEKEKENVIEEVNRAFMLYEKQMVTESYSILQKLMKEHPRNRHVCFGLGTYHANQQNYDEALYYLDRAIEISPDYAEAHYNKGSVYRDQVNIKRMIQSYIKVVDLGDPQEGYVQKARKMIETFEQHLRDNDITLADYFKGQDAFEQGMEAMKQNKWKKAITFFQKSINYYPVVPQPYNNLGICYGKLGQKELALQSFDKALEIDPNYEPAIVTRLAVLSLKDGEKIPGKEVNIIEYYKDYPRDKKSYIQSLIDKRINPEQTEIDELIV